MADRIIASGDAHPIPPVGGPTITLDLNELQLNLWKVRALGNLQEWIGNVRNRLAGIATRASFDPSFAEALKNIDFAGVLVEFDQDVAEGIEALQSTIRDHVHAIEQAIDQGARQ